MGRRTTGGWVKGEEGAELGAKPSGVREHTIQDLPAEDDGGLGTSLVESTGTRFGSVQPRNISHLNLT
jgi:hypothetical protein